MNDLHSYFYKTWMVHTDYPLDMSFDIEEFSGLTASMCLYGGYSLAIMSNESRGLDLFKAGTSIRHPHGPFCWSSPNVPFLGGKINTLTFPRGKHTITVYAYSDQFNIDIIVRMKIGTCTSITNICTVAMGLYHQKEYYTMYHNYIGSTTVGVKPGLEG